jgi:hypothetical protein
MEDKYLVIVIATILESFQIIFHHRLNFILESFFLLFVLHLFNVFVYLYLVVFLTPHQCFF